MRKRILIAGLCLVLVVLAALPVGCTTTTPTTSPSTTQSSNTTTTSNSVTTSTATTETTEAVVFPQYPRITAAQLKQMLDSKTDVVIIDVRDIQSYGAGHIPTAIDMEYNAIGDPQILIMTTWTLPMDRNIVVYCDCPDESSSGAFVDVMISQGFSTDKVKLLGGGLQAWRDIQGPMITGTSVYDSTTTEVQNP